MDSSSSTSFHQLPPDLITRVLLHASRTDRLKNCALVCKHWAAAAAAATTTVQLSDSGLKLHSLRSWLSSYHAHITSLQVSTADWKLMVAPPAMPALDFTALPCSNLRELDLQQLKLPGSGATASLQGFSQLTRLSLTSCYIPSAAVLLLPPLKDARIVRGLWGRSGSLVGSFLRSTALQGLTRLTLHDDSTGGLMAAALQHFSNFNSMQRLSLVCPPQTRTNPAPVLTEAALSGSMHALQNLTSLSLSHIDVTEVAAPCMMQLSALQHLKLVKCPGMQANVLASFTRLQHLHLVTFHGMTFPELLATLTGFTQLTFLSIATSATASAPAEAFRTLTASSKLVHLSLSSLLSPLLWDYVLPSGLQLPHLTRLEVLFCSPVPLQRLPEVCPALQELHLSIQENYGVPSSRTRRSGDDDQAAAATAAAAPYPIESLGELSGLTSLHLRAGDFSCVAKGVWQLTRLRRLQVAAWYPLRTDDVLGLTNLQQLTLLEFGPVGIATVAVTQHASGAVRVVNQAPEGSPPDVRQQLKAGLEQCRPQGSVDSTAARPSVTAQRKFAARFRSVSRVLLLGAACVAAAAAWMARQS